VSAGGPSSEFRLLAACCRWPTDAVAIAAATKAAAIDWERFVALARRHRVIGFAYHGLGAAGIARPEKLATRFRGLAARNLLLREEAARLAKLLAAEGIEAVFLKGATLAELAYRDQTIKQTLDNDLLVAPVDVAATIKLIQEAGYRVTNPRTPLNDRTLPVLIDMVKECTLTHANRAEVDLHWRMTSVKGLLAEDDISRDTQIVVVDGRSLRTLGDEALMVYLAVHGARHGWARLKWLTDFNALLVSMDDAAVASLRARADHAGVRRAMNLALIQSHRIFGTRLPDNIRWSRRVRWLVALSDALMTGPDELVEQRSAPRRYMAVGHASALLLKASPRYLANLAWSSWVSTEDALVMPLPRAARPLYLAISPAWRIARAFSRRQAQ